MEPSSSPSLEERRRSALAVVRECTRVLKNDFHAERVILFGSLAGDGPWHYKSDIDLAVVGLSEGAWWEAYGKVEAIAQSAGFANAPSGLKIDLVRLEEVAPEVRDRILQDTPMPDNKYLALKSRLENELTALERNYRELEKALEWAKTAPEAFATRTLVTYIDDFYRGCEQMGERIAVTIDGGLPQGENWHQELLSQVAAPGSNERPPLWSGSLLLELDEYRKFRHLVRHRYNDELKPERVLLLAREIQPVLTKVRRAVVVFCQWLENRAQLK